MPKKDANKIINHCFSDLIKWTYDDAVFQLTQIFSFTDEECEQLIKDKPKKTETKKTSPKKSKTAAKKTSTIKKVSKK